MEKVPHWNLSCVRETNHRVKSRAPWHPWQPGWISASLGVCCFFLVFHWLKDVAAESLGKVWVLPTGIYSCRWTERAAFGHQHRHTHPLFPTHTHSLSHTLTFFLTLVYPCPHLSHILSPSISCSLSLSLFFSLSHIISPSLSCSFSLSLSHIVSPSLSCFLSLSLPHSVSISSSLSLSLTYSLPLALIPFLSNFNSSSFIGMTAHYSTVLPKQSGTLRIL